LNLVVSDNGVGLVEEDLKVKTDSFGHKLIRAFKQKLNADVHIVSEKGTRITVAIKDYIIKA